MIGNTEKYNLKFVRARGIAFDLERIGKLQKISKSFMWRIIKFRLSIKNHPKNSLFVAFEFQKV